MKATRRTASSNVRWSNLGYKIHYVWEQVAIWMLMGPLIDQSNQTTILLIVLPIGATFDWNSEVRNLISLVLAIQIALDGPWW